MMPPQAPSYRRQWLVTIILLVVITLMIIAWHRHRVSHHPVPLKPAGTETADWFLLVRLPETPPGKPNAAPWAMQMQDWIQALRDRGFAIMPFTEILARRRAGQRLPARSVALLFDPGYRHTFETIEATVEAQRVPVLWLTETPGRFGTDRRFISPRQRRVLADAPLWNAGVHGADPSYFALETPDDPASPQQHINWHTPMGSDALNTPQTFPVLRRLHAHPVWTTGEFISRLCAEIPVEGTSILSTARIRGKRWGLMLPPAEGKQAVFQLEADPEQRSATVSWLGTRRCPDLQIDLRVDELYGELWVLLRSDRATGNRLRLGILPDRFDVDLEQNGQHHRLASTPRTALPGHAFSGTIVVQDGHFSLNQAGTPIIDLDAIDLEGTDESMLELVVFDMLRGTAAARGITLTVSPLPRPDHPSNREAQ
jgi:hypothetical protein